MASEIVILGSGLTAMAVSRTLDRRGLPHVVVGGPPDDRPRLGESLNLEGTLLLDEFCGEHHDLFGPKLSATGYIGDHVVRCGFDVAGKRVNRAFFDLLGMSAPAEFHHIDRVALDAALYDRMAASPTCRVVDAKIESVGYNTASDRVETVELSNGEGFRSSTVFDCTNHKRVVALAAGVPCTMLGVPQRVVYTHYHPPGRRLASPRPAYDLSTNLVRLFAELDGIDAVAWYIPLPSYLSIGVSMAALSTDLSDEDILERAEAAYARRGIHYRERYLDQAETMSLAHQYFVHERASGANWLLAGQTYASVWWTAGAGVGTSFVAGRMAADFVDDPAGVGDQYHGLLLNLLPIHDTFDWMATTTLDAVTEDRLRIFADAFIRTNVVRLAKSAQLGRRAINRTAGRLLEELLRRELIMKGYCDVDTAPLAEQTERIFGPERGTPAARAAADLVLELTDVISGRRPIDTIDNVLDPRVTSHLDGITVRGRKAWRSWLSFLRSRPGMADLELIDARTMLEPDGRITLHARWRAGGRSAVDQGSATYRVRGGRIVEIWTSRDNYEFVLGPVMTKRWGGVVALGRAALANRRRSG